MEIIYQDHPVVTLGGNTFVNVPIVLQYEETPILEVGKFVSAGYTTRFAVFHNDGTKIAVVSGSQIYLTDDGKKAMLKPRFLPNHTVIELEGKPVLEMKRDGATGLKGWAELHSPNGVLIKSSLASTLLGDSAVGDALIVGSMYLRRSRVEGCRVGVRYTREQVSVGIGPGQIEIGELRVIPHTPPPLPTA